jgi:RimJ/RimL family protein N-acetyltransferase
MLGGGLAQVSYWTLPRARGRGVAVAATRRLARFAFDDLGLVRLELMHSTVNPASCRVASKAGFAAEGVARQALQHADGWHDMHRHARLRDDETQPPGG